MDYKTIKRFLDIVFSFLLIIFLTPLFLIIGVIIKINSKGPVLYTQKRIGKDNITFSCYKFRTMHPEANYLLKEILIKNPNFKNEFAENLEKYGNGDTLKVTPVYNYYLKDYEKFYKNIPVATSNLPYEKAIPNFYYF